MCIGIYCIIINALCLSEIFHKKKKILWKNELWHGPDRHEKPEQIENL